VWATSVVLAVHGTGGMGAVAMVGGGEAAPGLDPDAPHTLLCMDPNKCTTYMLSSMGASLFPCHASACCQVLLPQTGSANIGATAVLLPLLSVAVSVSSGLLAGYVAALGLQYQVYNALLRLLRQQPAAGQLAFRWGWFVGRWAGTEAVGFVSEGQLAFTVHEEARCWERALLVCWGCRWRCGWVLRVSTALLPPCRHFSKQTRCSCRRRCRWVLMLPCCHTLQPLATCQDSHRNKQTRVCCLCVQVSLRLGAAHVHRPVPSHPCCGGGAAPGLRHSRHAASQQEVCCCCGG
jgi:hypothetical protein